MIWKFFVRKTILQMSEIMKSYNKIREINIYDISLVRIFFSALSMSISNTLKLIVIRISKHSRTLICKIINVDPYIMVKVERLYNQDI